jgi:hypothetical protein
MYGQMLHHQSINSQGNSIKLNTGLVVNQTIGQQSSAVTSKSSVVAQQGFQQSFWSTLIERSTSSNSLQFVVYPNPFVTSINFQFSNGDDQKATISIFDIQGRMLLNKEIKIINNLISMDLSTLSDAEYLVRLSTNSSVHYCKIIKNL